MSQKKDILVKVGFDCGMYLQVEDEKEFDTFEEANKWSKEKLETRYDTAEFSHIKGDEVMQSVINDYLDSLD